MNKHDRLYLAKLAGLGCILCGSPACIHHLRSGMGMGQRNTHDRAIPLCHFHHQGKEGIHTLGTKTWQKKYGTELELLEKTKCLLSKQS